jgi:hypothetical protein
MSQSAIRLRETTPDAGAISRVPAISWRGFRAQITSIREGRQVPASVWDGAARGNRRLAMNEAVDRRTRGSTR